MRGRDSMMLYKVSDGSVKEEHYGLVLARLVRLPETLVERATEVSSTLSMRLEEKRRRSRAYSVAGKRKLVLRLFERLVQARDGTMQEEALRSWLLRIMEGFLDDLAGLQREGDGSEGEESEGEIVVVVMDE